MASRDTSAFEAWSQSLAKAAYPSSAPEMGAEASKAPETGKDTRAQPWRKMCHAEKITKPTKGSYVVTRSYDADLSQHVLGGP